ncbi:uncharacterized protein LOC114263524 [Camellia sinensis]|uniref:uncharacterized protein LOC114263524 n=1 Tax=Camellia sinensis TaxID=4442 RepID=UPI0010359C10|nr:uncharacterized protein LOC114263524 [Camellia sinensis]
MAQQQRQQPLPPPPLLVQVESNNHDIINLTQKFMKMEPPTFLGGIEPLKAETWLLEMEKLFEVFPCSATEKVLLATYILKDEARRWWLLVRNNNGDMTWAQFNEIFYNKYFPQCFRDRKVLEFQELKQGRMSVAKYEAKFTELAWFAPHMVDTDYKKAWKFEGGLDLEVFDRVGVLKLPTYVEVLDRAIMAEATIAAMKQAKTPTTEWKSKRHGSNFRRGCSFSMNKKQNTGSSSSLSQSSGSIPVCSECGRKYKGICQRASGACFGCGTTGHMIRDCPMRFANVNHPAASSAGSVPVTRANTRTNARGNAGTETLRQRRVFSLMLGDVQNTKTVVSGIIPICAQNAYVLIDYGSTHSFVSHAFSWKLTRPIESVKCLLSVSTPSGSSMMCAYVYSACDVVISDVTLYVDLLPLNIDHFDCILGMDWLTKYCATIDYVNKTIMFKPPSMPEFTFTRNGVVPPPYLISFMKVKKLLRKGCRGYLCCALIESLGGASIETIPVVSDFPDVFPNDLLGDLIDREIEFTIDVTPGTQPISKTPYRMLTTELKELKLTQKNVPFDWNDQRESAFQELKTRLVTAPILTLPNGTEGFQIYSDASHKGLGCLLMQSGKRELLYDLEKNEIEIVIREQDGILVAISAQPVIIEEIKEKQIEDEFLKKIMDEIDSKPRPGFILENNILAEFTTGLGDRTETE